MASLLRFYLLDAGDKAWQLAGSIKRH